MGAAKSTLLITNARPHHEKSKMAQQLPQGGLTGAGTSSNLAFGLGAPRHVALWAVADGDHAAATLETEEAYERDTGRS